MTNVLVTGASGFIGRHLVKSLADDGATVHGLGRETEPPPGVSGWYAGGIDRQMLDALQGAGQRFDIIYHLAGGSAVAPSIANPLGDFRKTVDSTALMLDWQLQFAPDAALVVASSAAVYGAGHEGAIGEMAAIRPLSPYGTHKAMIEQMVTGWAQSFKLRAAIVRVFSAYGPGLRKQLLWDVCRRCEEAREVGLGGNGAEVRDWLHVSDVVRLLRVAASAADTTVPTINGGTGRGLSIAETARLLCTAWGDGRSPVFSGVVRAGDPPSLVADTRWAARQGFTPQMAFETGVDDYVRWFKGAVPN